MMVFISLEVLVAFATFWFDPLPSDVLAAYIGVIFMPLAAGLVMWLYGRSRPAIAVFTNLGFLAFDILLIAYVNRWHWL